MSLEQCVKNPVKYTGGKIDSIFMYVKNYCPHSKHAALRTQKFTTNVKCYDLETNRYVSHSDLNKYAGDGDGREKWYHFNTVPQIFAKVGTAWYHIGGRDDFDSIATHTIETKAKDGPNQYKF